MSMTHIEQRKLTTNSLSYDLARHLHARQWHGKAIVICNNPKALASSVMKQWVQLIALTKRERASTLNADRIRQLSSSLSRMECVRMTAKKPTDDVDCEVLFLEPDDVSSIPRVCRSVYIACDDAEMTLKQVRNRMAHGLIVCYL